MWNYRVLHQPVGAQTRAASTVSAARSRTCGRLYCCDTLLERLSEPFEDVTLGLGPRVEEQDAMVGQRHLARHRHLSPADESHRSELVA